MSRLAVLPLLNLGPVFAALSVIATSFSIHRVFLCTVRMRTALTLIIDGIREYALEFANTRFWISTCTAELVELRLCQCVLVSSSSVNNICVPTFSHKFTGRAASEMDPTLPAECTTIRSPCAPSSSLCWAQEPRLRGVNIPASSGAFDVIM